MKQIPKDIQKLGEKIERLKKKEQTSRQSRQENEYSYAATTGFRIATELVSGVFVGAALGWVLDKLFETRPVFLIIFLLLGGVAGFLNVYRFVKNEEKSQE